MAAVDQNPGGVTVRHDGGGGDEFSIMPVVYPRGMVSISSLGCFSSVGYSYKNSHPSLTLSLISRHIQEHFKNNRGSK